MNGSKKQLQITMRRAALVKCWFAYNTAGDLARQGKNILMIDVMEQKANLRTFFSGVPRMIQIIICVDL